jgi:hypothetical protein
MEEPSANTWLRPTLAASLVALLTLGLPVPVSAGPLVLEQVAKLTSPEPGFILTGEVTKLALDGDFALVSAHRFLPSSGDDEHAVFLYRRDSTGSWRYLRTLVRTVESPAGISFTKPVAMAEGIAAAGGFGLTTHIFERVGTDYVEAPKQNTNLASGDIEIDNGTVLFSDVGFDAEAYRRNSAGTWVVAGRATGAPRFGDDEQRGGDVDIWGTRIIGANPDNELVDDTGHVRLYTGPVGQWQQIRLDPPFPDEFSGRFFGTPVALDDTRGVLVVGDLPRIGLHVADISDFPPVFPQFDPRPAGTPDKFMMGRTRSIEINDEGLLIVGYPDDGLRGTKAGSVVVFRRAADGGFEQVARLLASDARDGTSLGDQIEVSGRSVIASGNNAAYIFNLPTDFTQPERRHDDFQDGNAADWTPMAGSNFAVVTVPRSRVYRQSSLAGLAGSFLNDTDWTTNQTIEAFIVPGAFAAGLESWFGLAVRRSDVNNYYYVTARTTNVLDLRRRVNGVVRTLATTSLPVVINRGYTLRLEASGTWIRVFLDGALRLQARDTSLRRGQAGILMSRTAASYDNVIVSPNPTVTLLADNFETGDGELWTSGADAQWRIATDGSRVFSQGSIAGGAFAVSGVPTGDQIVQTRAKATTFATGTDRWFGLMVRQRDERNYYYLTVRQSNQVLLRKLMNGTPVTLDSAPFTVNLGTWYTLRLEAIGDALRGYVNGRLLVEATDEDYAEGRYGPLMFKTAAHYDEFFARQP